MRQLINKALALLSTVVIAAGTIAMPAAAAGQYYDIDSLLVTLHRGESKTINMRGTNQDYPAIYMTGNTSKDTYVGVKETSPDHYQLTFYCGADEQATGYNVYIYKGIYSDHQDWFDTINVHVSDNLAGTSTTSAGYSGKSYAKDYAGFNQQIASDIRKAPQGGTVTVNAGEYTSFYRTAIAAITERPDVTIVVNYKYNKKAAQVTIPADAHIETLMDANGCIGFAALGAYASN